MLAACSTPQDTPTTEKKSVEKSLVANLEQGKALSKECQGCHGEKGERASQTMPFLAGQSAHYLNNALLAYQDGSRKNPDKRALLKNLSKQDLYDISHYFSQFDDVTWKWAKHHSNSHRASIIRGRVAATPCVDCHGLDGNSTISEAPSLAGISPEYFITAFDNYFSERRKGSIMKHFKHAVDWKTLHDLADFYASLPRLKPSIKSPGNPERGKKLAEKCAGCHGVYGETIVPSMPDLARQNPVYLVNAIRAYQSGKRQQALMKSEVIDLKNRDINDIASYYASLESNNREQPVALDEKVFDPIAIGENLSENCTACHGLHGNSIQPGTPSLSAVNPVYFMNALRAYQTDERKHQMMQAFAKAINISQAEKLALYFASQARLTPNKSEKQDVAEKPDVETLASCNGCHGDFGISTKASTPSLAAQDARYLENALYAYRDARRHNNDMQEATKHLDDQLIRQLAQFYAKQTPPPAKTIQLKGPEELAKRCNRCHGDSNDVDAAIPRIAGQSKPYLVKALLAYKSGDRVHTGMFAMAEILSLSEIEAIANYYGSKQKISQKP